MTRPLLTVLETRHCYRRLLRPRLQQAPLMSCLKDMLAAHSRDDLRASPDGVPLFRFLPTRGGLFLAIPRPETHPAAQDWSFPRMRQEGRFAYVAFWLHPTLASPGLPERAATLAQRQRGGTGLPNSPPLPSDLRRPPHYLHTLRDLEARHLPMLEDLHRQALALGQELAGAGSRISCFFQYPSQDLKSSLHLHLWWNHQEGEDEAGRRLPLETVVERLRQDPDWLRHRVACYRVAAGPGTLRSFAGLPQLQLDDHTLLLGADRPDQPEAREALALLQSPGLEALLAQGGDWRERGDELTLALLKPDAVRAGVAQAILARVEAEGFQRVREQTVQLSLEQAREFYAEHAHEPWFEEISRFMASGPLVVLALRRQGAIRAWRRLIGHRWPPRARELDPSCLRALYGSTGVGANAVHGSDSPVAVARELRLFGWDDLVPPAEPPEI